MKRRDKERKELHVSSLKDFSKQTSIPLLKRDNKAYDLASIKLINNLLEEREESSDLITKVVETLEFEKDTVFEYMVSDVISKCFRKLPEPIQIKLSNVILQQGALTGRSTTACNWPAIDFANDFYDLCDPKRLQNLLHQLAHDSFWETQLKVTGIIGKVFDALPNKKQAYYDLRMLSEHPKKEVKVAAKGSLSLIDFAEQEKKIAKIDQHLPKSIQPISQPSEEQVISILFLSADPSDASRLRLNQEVREIQEKLQLATLRKQFRLEQRMSTRPADISQALLDVQPQIVHFSGHGMATGALCFENQIGETHPIQPEAIAALFEQFAHQVNCVLLNACYSEVQAKALAKHIEYVIGMNKVIGDKAAISFAVGFYQALGGGRTIKDAYKLGCAQIMLQDIPGYLTPVFFKKRI